MKSEITNFNNVDVKCKNVFKIPPEVITFSPASLYSSMVIRIDEKPKNHYTPLYAPRAPL